MPKPVKNCCGTCHFLQILFNRDGVIRLRKYQTNQCTVPSPPVPDISADFVVSYIEYSRRKGFTERTQEDGPSLYWGRPSRMKPTDRKDCVGYQVTPRPLRPVNTRIARLSPSLERPEHSAQRASNRRIVEPIQKPDATNDQCQINE